MTYEGLPFSLPERPPVTRIRQRDTAELQVSTGVRTQPMAGFEDDFTDIVDYIVRITEQIWAERYDRDLEDIFAVQDEVTHAIVTTLEPQLIGEKPEKPDRACDQQQREPHRPEARDGGKAGSAAAGHAGW